MQAVILAAGKGKRLQPVTLTRSKAMAPVAGKPMVERVIDTFVANGIRQFVLVISPEDQAIRAYFREQSTLKADLQFVVQQERLGMAHALSLAAPHINQPFILSACDNIVPTDHIAELIRTYQTGQANAALSLMVLPPERISRSSAVAWHNGHIRRIVEKPSPEEAPSDIGSLPLYVFSPKLLAYLSAIPLSPRGEYELQDAIQMLIEDHGQVTGILTQERLQVTNAGDLLFLNRHYLRLSEAIHLTPQSIGSQTCLVTPLRIEAEAIIGPNCTIGPDVYIEGRCRIGANVSLKDAVILRDAVIEAGRQITGQIVS